MLKDILSYLLQNIVDHPDDVQVEEESENRKIMLKMKVNPEDIGKVIGKQGRIIHAIRDIVKLAAAKQNVYADVMLQEDAPPVSN